MTSGSSAFADRRLEPYHAARIADEPILDHSHRERQPLKIQPAQARRTTADVLIRFVCALEKPTAGGIGKTVGEIRAADAARAVRSAPRTTITACLGSQADCTTETVRRVGGAVARWLTGHNVGRADVDLAGIEALSVSGAVEALCEGLQLGAFRFDPYRSDKKRDRPVAVRLLPKRKSPTSNKTIARTAVIADAVNLARRWGHEPPNVINPVTLAARIVKLARRSRLKCRVLDDKQLVRMKANAIVQVGIASKTPARLIVLEHAGKPGTKNAKPVVLVGKAITFDTGGYSLKDKTGIVGMKYDKCGGMAVVGVMQAVATLKLKTPVVGIIAAAENMIAGNAYRPNDIVTTMSGKTVEIISTDAEGRMVLADALTYAQKQYKPRAIIDLATLTGGVVIALGSVRAGLFANNDALA
ncbi:MAG: leucyl aminopeptidase family protein, partial [Planctomycetes bacterium]|nr:leucyl aminopeptidase family protein [Planctomycetota bacterium]